MKFRPGNALNHSLEILATPTITIFGRRISAFQFCGCVGVALAMILTLTLASQLRLSAGLISGIVAAAVATFFALVMATKIITGEERIIYYHHEIAVLTVTGLLVWLVGGPVAAYLDVTVLGIGVFLVCGRIGCLMAGCCHGRPHTWGVCYHAEHARAGFTAYFVGVRLFPIQAVESLWVLCIVCAGVFFVLRGHPPGTALAWYVITYDLGRFCFEFMRGDPDRPYLWGFSQPQWISLLLMLCVAGAELAGDLPFHWWHVLATAGLALAIIVVALKRRRQKTAKHQLLHPRHIREVAEALDQISPAAMEEISASRWTILPERKAAPAPFLIACTSLGVQISTSKIADATGSFDHYSLSHRNGEMTEDTARALAALILQLRRATGSGEFLKGNRDVFHLLIRPMIG